MRRAVGNIRGRIGKLRKRDVILAGGGALFIPIVFLTISTAVSIARCPYVTVNAQNRPSPATLAPDSVVARLRGLRIEKNYYQSMVSCAQQDSVVLVLNLPESLASLQIRGLAVRECRIRRFRVNSGIGLLKSQARLGEWQAGPFTLQDYAATLAKVPIQVKDAPTDTVEAAKKGRKEPKPPHEDAWCTLWFDRGLMVDIRQSENIAPDNVGRFYAYRAVRLKSRVIDSVRSLFGLRSPRDMFAVEIELEKSDIRAVYRALPTHASMILCVR